MYIKTDNDFNIIEIIDIGGIPSENGYEVESIPKNVCQNFLSYKYINGEYIFNQDKDILQENIEIIRDRKISIMSTICNNCIINGVDVGGSHYSLTINDQTEMIKLESMIKNDSSNSVFYHADGEKCRLFSAEEFLTISTYAMGWITYHRTYFNLLKSEINDMTDVEEIMTINYGDPLNEINQNTLNTIMQGNQNLYQFPIIEDTTDYEVMFKQSYTPIGEIIQSTSTGNIDKGDNDMIS